MDEEKVVIVLSGGMDSGVLCAGISKLHAVHAITFDYGSNHNAAEIAKAKVLAAKYCRSHKIVKLDFIKDLFKSSLLEGAEAIPEGHYEAESMKSTVVPFRNGIMLSIATGYAESIEATKVYIGSHAGDHYIYPDCRPAFNTMMTGAIKVGTEKGIKLVTPYATKTKRDIGVIGSTYLGFDFNDTYTCYKGDPETHCGVCGSCTERKEALEGFDPTNYLV